MTDDQEPRHTSYSVYPLTNRVLYFELDLPRRSNLRFRNQDNERTNAESTKMASSSATTEAQMRSEIERLTGMCCIMSRTSTVS